MALLAEASVQLLAGHVVHTPSLYAASVVLYLPTAQATQTSGLGPVSFQYPAAHSVQSARDVLPTLDVTKPVGQLMQLLLTNRKFKLPELPSPLQIVAVHLILVISPADIVSPSTQTGFHLV
jgi:hypothetical protein